MRRYVYIIYNMSSPPVFSGVRVTRSIVLCVCFVYRWLSFCTFSFAHCVVCSSSTYGFWLPLWYLQTLLIVKYMKDLTLEIINKLSEMKYKRVGTQDIFVQKCFPKTTSLVQNLHVSYCNFRRSAFVVTRLLLFSTFILTKKHNST